MKNELMSYSDYKSYILDLIKDRQSGGHGEKTKIAKALRCHAAYVSQVLHADAHFSLEQAASLNKYLGHNPEESDFLLTLVSYCRAGSPDLKKYFAQKLDSFRKKKMHLKTRLNDKTELASRDEEAYFGNWIHIATHLLLSIPRFKRAEDIAHYLGTSATKVRRAISFLTSRGIVNKKQDQYTTGKISIHLGHDTDVVSRHHENWRLRAIESLGREDEEDFHYSSVVTIDQDSARKIKRQMMFYIEEIRKEVRASKEEDLYCYNLDLFKVGGVKIYR